MCGISSLVGWVRSWDYAYWMLFLTIWMTCLTAAILVLTIAVVCYAKRTLRVSKASLDLFSEPSVMIQGPQEVHGPYPGDNFAGPWRLSPRVILTLWNNSPMEILVPRSVHSLRILAEESSNPTNARKFSVTKCEPRPGQPSSEGPYVVQNTLPYMCELRGPSLGQGDPPLRLVVEFRIESYLYRGKPRGPSTAQCAFIIAPQ